MEFLLFVLALIVGAGVVAAILILAILGIRHLVRR